MDADPRLLIWLKLGGLAWEPACKGYACGCACDECQERSQQVTEEFLDWLETDAPTPPAIFPSRDVRQPWEIAA